MAFYKKVEVGQVESAEKCLQTLQSHLPEDHWFAFFEYGAKGIEALFEGQLNEHYKSHHPCVFYCTEDQTILSAGKLISGQGFVLAFGYDSGTVREMAQEGHFHKSILYAFSAHEYKHNNMYPNEKKVITVIENKQFLYPDAVKGKLSESDSLEP